MDCLLIVTSNLELNRPDEAGGEENISKKRIYSRLYEMTIPIEYPERTGENMLCRENSSKIQRITAPIPPDGGFLFQKEGDKMPYIPFTDEQKEQAKQYRFSVISANERRNFEVYLAENIS